MVSEISKYDIGEKLFESKCTIIYRAYRTEDRQPVILKILKHEAATSANLDRFRREFSIISKLDVTGAIKAYELEEYQGSLMMVIEDIGGESLDRLLKYEPMPLGEFLLLAIRLSDIMGGIHHQRIIHKNINPSNIIWNKKSGHLRLIDFDLADELPQQSVGLQPASALEGMLEYISPEQTGRMNRLVDYRTDFYSLGVTFYKILTGRLPFQADDALALVHSHIARTPIPPHELNPSIPLMPSRIVMKLMAKTAEDRYQSSLGLKADLEKCLHEMITTGEIRPFELGEDDFSDQFHIPQKLYGREKEIQELLESFQRVATDERELFLVRGYAGVGKTALVHEIYQPVTEKRGYYIEGKFDQLQRNIPYSAWIQAFTGLVRYLLVESESQLATWKRDILAAVGSLGKILTDVIPDLELIIGLQPEVPPLGGNEAQNRFNFVFQEFVKVFAKREHPLVVFLDDMQWIDTASLSLLRTLLTAVDISSLLVIGAYRDNEVDANHPLRRFIKDMRKEKTGLELLTLGNLSEVDVNALISDTAHQKPTQTLPLAQLVYSKTAGNAFFTHQTLRSLVDKQAITFDIESRSWQWDINVILAMDITDNVVSLMVEKLRRLPVVTQNLLTLGACIGNQFDLKSLSIIANESEEITGENLEDALREGLIVPFNEHYRFVHDRVQQAAYSLIPQDQLAVAHLRIGRLLLERTPSELVEDKVFDIVNQLNLGVQLIENTDEKYDLAELNLIAGKRAMASNAYDSADGFLSTGLSLLKEDSWETKYKLTYELYLNLAECKCWSEFSCCGGPTGDYSESERLVNVILQHTKNNIDYAAATRVKQSLYIVQGQFANSVQAAIECLRLFGIELWLHPTREQLETEYSNIWTNLGDRPIEDLINLPAMTDSQMSAVMGIMTVLKTPAMYTDNNLTALMICHMVNISLQYGNADSSGIGYVWFGQILGPEFGEYQKAFRFGKLGYDMAEKLAPTGHKAKIYHCFGQFINPYTHHLRTSVDILQRAFDAAIEVGDFIYACYTSVHRSTLLFVKGDPLGEVYQESEKGLDFVRRIKFRQVAYGIIGQQRLFLNLRGLTNNFSTYSDARFDQDDFEAFLAANEEKMAIMVCQYYIFKLIARFYSGDYYQALQSALKAKELLWTSPSLLEVPEFYYFYSLTLAALFEEATPEIRSEYLETLAENQKQLKIWSDNCPENFYNKYALVTAEIARISGDCLTAEHLYEQSIRSAAENDFVQNEAIGYELASNFYQSRGYEKIANTYIKEARRCYIKWEAEGKVRQIDHQHPWILEEERVLLMAREAGTQLDTITVVKALQAISSEIDLSRLLETLMKTTIENAGAQKGYLILSRGDNLQIEAEAVNGEIKILPSIPVVASSNIPQSIINYVARTREKALLDNASSPNMFSNDDYVINQAPKSVLCMPILRKTELVGILYLENDLATGVFSADRYAVLELLASQAAISIENAQLYSDLYTSQQQLQAMMDNSVAIIQVKDIKGRYLLINRRHEELFHVPMKDLIGKTVYDIYPKELADILHENDLKVLTSGRPLEIEEVVPQADGPHTYLTVKYPLFTLEGTPYAVCGISTDITERKRAIEERNMSLARMEALWQLTQMRESEESELYNVILMESVRLTGSKYGLIAKISEEGKAFALASWTPEVSRDCQIPEAQHVLELGQLTLLGKPVKDKTYVIDNECRELVQSRIPVGHVPIERVLVVPILHEGEVTQILAVANKESNYGEQDANQLLLLGAGAMSIIERRWLEDELKELNTTLEHRIEDRTAQLEITNRELEAFTYSVSHDLRAPLRSIDGFSQAIVEDYSDKLDATGQDYISRVRMSAQRMGQLIDDLLRLSRVARAEMKFEATDMSSLAREILADLQRNEPDRNVESKVQDRVITAGDSSLLRIALENLIGNAWKYTGKKPVAEIEFGSKILEGEQVYYVRDNGAGFDIANAGKLFKPFQRLHTEDEFPGSGIGLAIVQRIISRHGGRIWTEAEVGKGATFYFVLGSASATE